MTSTSTDNPTRSPASRTTLAYADLPERWGLAVARAPTSLRLIIPPVPGVRQLPNGMKIGAAALLGLVLFFAGNLIMTRVPDLSPFIANLCMYGLALLIVLAAAWERLSRRLALEVNTSQFSIMRLSRHGGVISPRSWPRAQIGGAKYNLSNGKLVIRIIGIDMLDVYVSPNRAVTEWVARAIDDALREIPVESTAPSHASSALAPMRKGWARTLLIAIAISLSVIGIVMFFTPLAPLALYVILLGAAPAGIALGTQEKENYWFF